GAGPEVVNGAVDLVVVRQVRDEKERRRRECGRHHAAMSVDAASSDEEPSDREEAGARRVQERVQRREIADAHRALSFRPAGPEGFGATRSAASASIAAANTDVTVIESANEGSPKTDPGATARRSAATP